MTATDIDMIKAEFRLLPTSQQEALLSQLRPRLRELLEMRGLQSSSYYTYRSIARRKRKDIGFIQRSYVFGLQQLRRLMQQIPA